MTQLITRFERNTAGRDLAVGDIHGAFSKLELALAKIDFDPAKDRLFSVGDLVDRGPECHRAMEFLEFPWFNAVQGNHEDIAVRFVRGNPVDRAIYARNGGQWFMDMPAGEQRAFGLAFMDLPYAIEVETDAGLVGIVHADCPIKDWNYLGVELLFNRNSRYKCMWSRSRIESENIDTVENIRAVIVGHTPLESYVRLGNVHYIDTLAWAPHGFFTFMDLATLTTIEAR